VRHNSQETLNDEIDIILKDEIINSKLKNERKKEAETKI